MERQLHSVRSDKHRPYFRTGQVSDDVECLEIVAETVMFSNRNGVEDAEVIPTV